MGRSRYLAILAGTMLAGLCLPSASLASAYSWDLPANFTTSSPGANPDHDVYGAAPWSYLDAATPLVGAPRYQSLTAFASPTHGGLAGWTDPGSTDVLVAANPSGASVSSGPDVFLPDTLVMSPGALGRQVAVAWTSQLSLSALVNVTGSITAADPGPCASTFTWSLNDQTGAVLQSGTATSGAISFSPTVDPGGTIYLTVHPGLAHSRDCDTALVSLHIDAPGTSAPSITLADLGSQPLPTATPTLSGQGAPKGKVALTIYPGASASGTPAQTTRGMTDSSGKFSVKVSSGLANGEYTVVAAQTVSGVLALSNPVTFTIKVARRGSGRASIGSTVQISRTAVASLSVTCRGSAGQFCAGTVLVLTLRRLRPLAGGPFGSVRVLFAYVNIPGGTTQMVSRRMRPDVARVLRGLKSVRIRVSANLTGAPSSTIMRTLQFSR